MGYQPRHGELLEVLERNGWRATSKTSDRATGKCIFHEDKSPSFSVNIGTNQFKCHSASCDRHGGLKDIWAHYGMPNLFAEKSAASEDHSIDILKSNLWSADGDEALKLLHDRGFDDETLKKFNIGVSFKLIGAELSPPYRIVIPIYNVVGDVGYTRRYHPDGKTNEPSEIYSVADPSKRTEPKAQGAGDKEYEAECPSCHSLFGIARKDAGNEIACPKCSDALKVVGTPRKMSFLRGNTGLLYGCNKLKWLTDQAASSPKEVPPPVVFVVEGEWDRLMMEQHGFNAVTGIGAGTWKDDWNQLFDGLDVVILYDKDKAGEKGGAKAREALQKRGKVARIRVAHWPFGDQERLPNGKHPKDVCDWFLLGKTADELWSFVEDADVFALSDPSATTSADETSGSAGWLLTPASRVPIINRIDEIRNEDMPMHSKRRAISEKVLADLIANGKCIRTKDHDLYYFNSKTHRLYTLGDKHFKSSINIDYRVNSTEPEYKFLEQDLNDYTLNYGTLMQVRKFCHFDKALNAVYITQYNGSLAKISATGVEIVDNGTDSVFFLDADMCDPWAFNTAIPQTIPEAVPTLMKYMTDICYDPNLCDPPIQAEILMLWLVSLFFGADMQTRPLCTFLGPRGSGKTMALKRFLKLFYGPDANVTSVRQDGQDDMQAAIMSGYLVVFDNVDNESEFMNDELAKIATGQVITRRELYTTLGAKTFKPDCFVGITSHTPHFTRSDVIDRMLLFRLARRETNSVEPTLGPAERAEFFSALVPIIQAVLVLVAAGKRPTVSPYRMADWSTWAHVIALALGRTDDEATNILSVTEQMRVDLQVEEDPIIHIVARWLSTDPTKLLQWHSGHELAADWNKLLKEEGARYHYSSKWIGRKVKDATKGLSRRWILSVRKDPKDNVEQFMFSKKPGVTLSSYVRPMNAEPEDGVGEDSKKKGKKDDDTNEF